LAGSFRKSPTSGRLTPKIWPLRRSWIVERTVSRPSTMFEDPARSASRLGASKWKSSQSGGRC
jgi:hypothetical protein